MKQRYSSAAAKILAWIVFLILVADLLMKSSADLQQVMWACYWASAAIIVGVTLGLDRPVAWGVVFFSGIGLPAWLLGFLFGRPLYSATSVLIHSAPLVAGLVYFMKMRALPRYTAFGAWLLYVVPFVLAWRYCNPAAMINLSHLRGSMLPEFFPGLREFYAATFLATGISVGLMAYLFDRLLRYRAARPRSGNQRMRVPEALPSPHRHRQ